MRRPLIATLSLVLLAAAPRHASIPDPSRDGARIVFQAERDGRSQIFIMNADGSGARKLHASQSEDFGPVWSPDGKWIAFCSYISDAVPMEIVAIDAEGSNRRTIAKLEDATWPRISPDGKRIAFCGVGADKARAIFIVNADGTNLYQFPSGLKEASNPEWSPDGTLLLFTTRASIGGKPGDSTTIYVADPLGKRRREIATVPMALQMSRWSPDGKTVAFQQNLGGKEANIVLLDIASGKVRTITHRDRAYLDETPAWLPDGRLLFQTTRDGSFEIYRMNADGTGVTRISR